MRKKIVLSIALLLPSFLLSQEIGLRQLIEHAEIYNGQINASKFQVASKESQVSAAKRDYLPTIDIGGSYTRLNPIDGFSPENTTRGFVVVGLGIFDSGRKRAQVEASRFAHEATLWQAQGVKLGVTLDVINRYYILQQQHSALKALETKSNELKAQLDRLDSFMRAGLAMRDEVDRLRAAFEDSRYQIEAMRFDIEETKENLRIQTGVRFENMQKQRLKEPSGISMLPSHDVQQTFAQSQEVVQMAKAVNSSRLPQISLENRYTISDYRGFSQDSMGSDFFAHKQNSLVATGTMRVFDGGKIAKEREALMYQQLALDSQKEYLLEQQKSQFDLASKRLKTLQSQRISTKSALNASESSYKAVVGKFEAGIVDYVIYLDALSDVISAQVRHEKADYDFEIAKALYYYYAGRNPKEFIQ